MVTRPCAPAIVIFFFHSFYVSICLVKSGSSTPKDDWNLYIMGSKRRDSEEPHGIRLPGSILDKIKTSNEGEDNSRFEFGSASYNKKRKVSLSRKEQRKQERSSKKSKNIDHVKRVEKHHSKLNYKSKIETKKEPKKDTKTPINVSNEEEFTGFPSDDSLSSEDFDDDEDLDDEEFSDDDDQPQTAEDTMRALVALKAKKNGSDPKNKKKSNLSAGETMALLKAAKKNKSQPEPESDSGESEDFEDDMDDAFTDEEFSDEDQPQTAEDVFAALKAAKAKKNGMSVDLKTKKDKKNETKEKKEKKDKKDKKDKNEKKDKKEQKDKKESQPKRRQLTDEEESLMKRDERDMKHYAKLLGMKSTKLKDLKKNQVDDGLDDLLEGLDFMDEYDDAIPEDEYDDDDEGEKIEYQLSEEEDDDDDDDDDKDEIIENPFSDDDEINSSDFDSDLDGEFDDEEEEEGDVIMAGPKENPYVAPVNSTKKYIPPAMRARMSSSSDSELVLKIKRLIKGPLNKLSEANVLTIVNDVNAAYLDNPRQVVTEVLTSVILESIVQQSMLLDTFVTLHAALMTAIYKLQGVEVGAYFIQTLVEKYEEHYKNEQGKEAGNLISLLTACYSLQLISCKLLYNLISTLITSTSELNSELLLRIVRNAGQQMRSDDPQALKEIILQFQQTVQGQDVNPRTRFLIETITNLKNNKSKNANETTHQLIIRMKKVLAGVNNKMNEPLQVSLDDIHNVETKGKWWLVGSAWRGNMSGEPQTEVNDVDKEEMNDILDSAEPNWMELAKSQRMNTDIRRAIFISMMSSQDYIEAFTKLDKLRLKRSQEREIPRIMLHCVSMEKVYNPYYGLLANKLCSEHSLRKTFQFCFWDLLKELEGDDGDDSEDEGSSNYFKKLNHDLAGDNEDFQLQRSVNQGKFFGVLMSEGSLPLHSLKSLNFLSLNQDISLFLEVLMISFFDGIGKKCEVSAFGAGTKKSKKAEDLRFEDKGLLEFLVKCKEQKILLRGLQYFLQAKVRGSDIISGRRQRKRVEWGVDTTCDVAGELLKALE